MLGEMWKHLGEKREGQSEGQHWSKEQEKNLIGMFPVQPRVE